MKMDDMTCMEFLSIATKQASISSKDVSGSVEKFNGIYNAFMLRSIAYSLAVIADKLREEGDGE